MIIESLPMDDRTTLNRCVQGHLMHFKFWVPKSCFWNGHSQLF